MNFCSDRKPASLTPPSPSSVTTTPAAFGGRAAKSATWLQAAAAPTRAGYRPASPTDKVSTGFFDEDFFVYREDVDLAWRLRGRGWSARCVPSAVAWHRRRNLPERRKAMSAVANLHSVKNRFLLRINNAGPDHLRATFPLTFARDAVVVGGCLTVERTSFEALRWLAQNRARLLGKRREILSYAGSKRRAAFT